MQCKALTKVDIKLNIISIQYGIAPITTKNGAPAACGIVCKPGFNGCAATYREMDLINVPYRAEKIPAFI